MRKTTTHTQQVTVGISGMLKLVSTLLKKGTWSLQTSHVATGTCHWYLHVHWAGATTTPIRCTKTGHRHFNSYPFQLIPCPTHPLTNELSLLSYGLFLKFQSPARPRLREMSVLCSFGTQNVAVNLLLVHQNFTDNISNSPLLVWIRKTN